MDNASDDRYLPLRNGIVAPADPYRLLFELTDRGFVLSREDGDVLLVRPHQHLTADDCVRIRRWKWHLLALLDYIPTVEVQ